MRQMTEQVRHIPAKKSYIRSYVRFCKILQDPCKIRLLDILQDLKIDFTLYKILQDFETFYTTCIIHKFTCIRSCKIFCWDNSQQITCKYCIHVNRAHLILWPLTMDIVCMLTGSGYTGVLYIIGYGYIATCTCVWHKVWCVI